MLGFHGYAQTCEHLIPGLELCFGSLNPTLCSIQGLSYFYRKNGEVVASWMTKLDREMAIENNLRYIEKIHAEVSAKSGSAPLVFFGFSQGAAMAYRMSLLGSVSHSYIIAVGGELPPELRSHRSSDETNAPTIVVCRAEEDPFYSGGDFARDCELLAKQHENVIAISYEGAHEVNASLSEKLSERIPFFSTRDGDSE